jgi:anti-anti-sigma regulatory factor
MPTALALPRELTIYAVTELRHSWLTWLAGSHAASSVDIAAEAVEEVDAAGVQLLLALAQSLQREHIGLRWLAPSAALQAACDALGLAALLADSEPAGALA